MTAVIPSLHALIMKVPTTMPSDCCLAMLVATLPMEFIHISPWGNYVRQYVFLNDQGGTNTVITEQRSSITLPIQSKVLAVNATVKVDRNNPQGINGVSIYTDIHENRNIYITADVDDGDEVNKNIKVWWIAIGVAK